MPFDTFEIRLKKCVVMMSPISAGRISSHPIYFAGGDNFNQIIMKSIYAYTNIIYVCMYKYRLYLCISICMYKAKKVRIVSLRGCSWNRIHISLSET